MKWYNIAHLALTIVLALTVVVFLTLLATGIIGVQERSPNGMAVKQGQNDGPVAGAKARLLVVRGLRPNWEYPIFEGMNIIGRADQEPVEIDLQPQEPEERIWSSRQHAAITCEGGALMIEDLNSANGTYVNRTIVRPGTKRTLKTGDLIQIGEVQLKVLQ